MSNLGRLIPLDWKHVEKYPFSALSPLPVGTVEKVLMLPSWQWSHNQGSTGSCVGHGVSMERAITNTRQNILAHLPWPRVRRYNPLFVWNEAKKIDEWSDTNPGDNNGTSVRAGYDVARTRGLARVRGMRLDSFDHPYSVRERAVDINEGILATRWAVSVDEIRSAIYDGIPVTIGINWYEEFDHPYRLGRDWFLPKPLDLGSIRGGHCVVLYGASDERQAFKLKNSWGKAYPLVWLPYVVMERLLNEQAEAALVTDK